MGFFLRHKKWFLGFLAFGIGAYVVSLAGLFAPGVPPEFTEARLHGALIAENIVGLSRESADSLQRINRLDAERKFAEALSLTQDLIKRSQQIRDKAVELSAEIEKMTQALSKISSFEARQAALESIASRLALINRLINYSAYLSDLLNALSARFSGAPGDHEVVNLITQINSEVTAINSFNEQAGRAMERFDKIVK